MALHDRILLATDLSGRSDRALDRAMMLAQRASSELVVLHVIEPMPDNRFYPRTQSLPVLAGLARQQLRHDLGDCVEKAQVRVEEGDPAEVIERVAAEAQATLVVVGVARVERLGRFMLGKTVERLVRALEMPMLIVKDRPRKPYEHVAVAVDFSPVSTQMIQLATSLYPDQVITAFHAYEPLRQGSTDPEVAAAQATYAKQDAITDFANWFAAVNLVDARNRVVPRIELGEPSRLLREAAEHGRFDLVVIGTRGRGRVFEFFIGSVAKRILAGLPCDALFVREAR